jgi:hypothetical protein
MKMMLIMNNEEAYRRGYAETYSNIFHSQAQSPTSAGPLTFILHAGNGSNSSVIQNLTDDTTLANMS